jgi:hypothetical protein
MAIWYNLWSFGIFSPILVRCTEKNLATLAETVSQNHFQPVKGFLSAPEPFFVTSSVRP